MGHLNGKGMRKIYYWKLRDSEMQLGERTLLMGVLNITPDSFSDGGRFLDPETAIAHGNGGVLSSQSTVILGTAATV